MGSGDFERILSLILFKCMGSAVEAFRAELKGLLIDSSQKGGNKNENDIRLSGSTGVANLSHLSHSAGVGDGDAARNGICSFLDGEFGFSP